MIVKRPCACLPKSPEALLARGGSYHALGMHAQGLADRSEAIRLNPALAEAWCARGSAYFLLGDFEKAASDLEHALQLKPDYQEASEVLAKARHELTLEPVASRYRGNASRSSGRDRTGTSSFA